MKVGIRNLGLWALVFSLLAMATVMWQRSNHRPTELTFTEFQHLVTTNQIKTATIEGVNVEGELLKPKGDSRYYHTVLPTDLQNYTPDLVKRGIKVVAKDENSGQWLFVFLNVAPMLLLLFLFLMWMKQMQQGGNKAMTFGKARVKMNTPKENPVTFKDVAGIDEVKEELAEIIEFLKEPQKFTRLGGRIPKGVLLMGPPGTGKTLLARAVAGEAAVPFFSISGSEFVELFVGVGASRVRDLFEQGKRRAPCIIFIDEIDAVGRKRGFGFTGGNDEREQTLNQLLVEMDGFDSSDGVIIVAASNRPDVLDQALMRPGRFDRRIVVPRPDLRGREAIFQVHTRKTTLSPAVDLSVLARGTPGFSGADIENLVNEAALRGARMNRDAITMGDFEYAKDKVLMGSERRSLILSEEERRSTAFHEAGHTVCALKLKNADPIHKVSIVPRGMALGVTQQLPEGDRHSYHKEYLLDRLVVMLGGRASEQIFLGTLTTGAGNDLEQATDLARHMVATWGMSEKLGPLSFQRPTSPFLSLETSPPEPYSEETARLIDSEIRALVTEALANAEAIMKENRDLVDVLVVALLERESLDRTELESLMAGETLPPQIRDIPKPPKPEHPEDENEVSQDPPSQVDPGPDPDLNPV